MINNKKKSKTIKSTSSFYDNKVVLKPWGYEYVVFRNKNNNLSVTLLNINYNKSTSLHCHPKKSGFILLKGKAEFQLGLRKKNTESKSSPAKRMMARVYFIQLSRYQKRD